MQIHFSHKRKLFFRLIYESLFPSVWITQFKVDESLQALFIERDSVTLLTFFFGRRNTLRRGQFFHSTFNFSIFKDTTWEWK